MKKHQVFTASVMVGLGVLMGAASAHASVVYSYAFDQASYQLAPGQSLSVPVYFQEAVDGTDVSKLTTENGLAIGSVLLQKTSLTGGVQITRINANPLFDGTVSPDPATAPFSVDSASLYATTLDPVLAALNGVTVPTQGVLASEQAAGSGTWRILLGSFEFTAIGNPGDDVTFQAAMPNSTSDMSTWNAVYGDNPTYEVLGNATGAAINGPDVTFTVTAVPEPASLGIGLMGLGFVLLCRRVAGKNVH